MRPVIALLLAGGLLLPAVATDAQPAPAEPQQQVTLQQFIPVEGIIGFLTFEQRLATEQYLAVRDILVATYDAREQIVVGVRQGQLTQGQVRDSAVALRDKMAQALAEVLNDEQSRVLLEKLGMTPPEDG